MKNTTFRIVRTIVLSLIVIITVPFIIGPQLIGEIIHGKNVIRARVKCMDQMGRIADRLKEYFDKYKQYPQSLQDALSDRTDLIKRHSENILKCSVSKNRESNIDYDYFVDSFNNIILYEKEKHHYIGWWFWGLKPYNARNVLIWDGKNKDIKLYSDDDFKILLDKHQCKPDKENK